MTAIALRPMLTPSLVERLAPPAAAFVTFNWQTAPVDPRTHRIMRIVDQVSQWDGAPRTVPPRAIPSDLFPREMKRIDFSGLESPYPAAGTPKAKMAPSDPEFGGALENVTSSVRGKSESPYSAFFSFSLLGEKKPPEDKAPIQSIRRQENSP